ncbi:MAG: hypothetical protein ACD_32C00157G0001 [uncultured bacterium]|nr:MAG: hypothetical protein ACD_32C00157G0001 [uncultured bacterium]
MALISVASNEKNTSTHDIDLPARKKSSVFFSSFPLIIPTAAIKAR